MAEVQSTRLPKISLIFGIISLGIALLGFSAFIFDETLFVLGFFAIAITFIMVLISAYYRETRKDKIYTGIAFLLIIVSGIVNVLVFFKALAAAIY